MMIIMIILVVNNDNNNNDNDDNDNNDNNNDDHTWADPAMTGFGACRVSVSSSGALPCLEPCSPRPWLRHLPVPE